MGNFKQIGGKRFNSGRNEGFGRQGGGRTSFPAKSWSGSEDRDRGPVTMHRTTCGQCGNPCEVPFRPISGKTVYCGDCFRGKKDAQDDRGSNRFEQKMFDDHKTYANHDFRNNTGKENNDGIKNQLEILNAKMDRLIRAVETMANAKPLPGFEKQNK